LGTHVLDLVQQQIALPGTKIREEQVERYRRQHDQGHRDRGGGKNEGLSRYFDGQEIHNVSV
jgi:hypothetical protein